MDVSCFFSLKGVAFRVLDMNKLKTTEWQRTIEPVQLINNLHLFYLALLCRVYKNKKFHKESLKAGFQLIL